MLSAHCSERELACPCCGVVAVEQILLDALEQLRGRLAMPLRILSGYRCRPHNAAVGGEPDSTHMRGLAADVAASCGWRAVYQAACEIPAFAGGGIGVYPAENFVHVDARGRAARWARLNGRYGAIDQALTDEYITLHGKHRAIDS